MELSIYNTSPLYFDGQGIAQALTPLSLKRLKTLTLTHATPQDTAG